MNFFENIIKVDSVDSTNSYAERILKVKKVPEGTVIMAYDQVSGQGQGENKWLSEPGKNLTISLILYPRFLPPERQFMLNKSVSLGVLDFAHNLLPAGSCRLKWPNDIYSGSLKLGGILISNTVLGSVFDTSIIGIGINMNQTQFDPSIPNPISICSLLNHETDLDESLITLMEKIDRRYEELKNGNFEKLDMEYDKNLLGYKQNRKFISGDAVFDGIIVGVDPYGRLIIETNDNRRLTFAHKAVELFF